MDMSRRALLGATAASVLLAACNRTTANGSGDLNGILDRLCVDFLRESPEYATSLAVSEEQAGGRYIDRLSDASKEAFIRNRGIAERGVQELQGLDRATLSAHDAVTYDVVLTALQNQVESARFEFGGGAGGPYVISQLTGSYTNIPDFLASQHPITNREQTDAYLTRLSAYARVLDQETARFGEDSGAGVLPPDFAMDGAIRQLTGFAGTAPAQTVLVSSFVSRLANVAEITAADKTALQQRAETIVRDEVLPAYRRQIEALTAARPAAAGASGGLRLHRSRPDGTTL